jgi:cytochrome c-type biogenesis protein CcmE
MWQSEHAGTTSRHRPPRGYPRLLVALLAIDAVVLTWAFSSESAFVYSVSVADVAANPERWLAQRHVRVEGVLLTGSLRRAKSYCELRFRLSGLPGTSHDGPGLRVKYRFASLTALACEQSEFFCDVPGLELPLSVEGHLANDSEGPYLAASEVYAKCPSKYEVPRTPDGAPVRCPPIPIDS